mgnify:CR=1 FL=1
MTIANEILIDDTFESHVQTVFANKPTCTESVYKIAQYLGQGNSVVIETLGWVVEVGVTTIQSQQCWYAKRQPPKNNELPVLAFFSLAWEWVEFIETCHYRDLLVSTVEAKIKEARHDEQA